MEKRFLQNKGMTKENRPWLRPAPSTLGPVGRRVQPVRGLIDDQEQDPGRRAGSGPRPSTQVGGKHQGEAHEDAGLPCQSSCPVLVEGFGGIILLPFPNRSYPGISSFGKLASVGFFFKKIPKLRDHSEGADSLRSAPVARDSALWTPPDGPPPRAFLRAWCRRTSRAGGVPPAELKRGAVRRASPSVASADLACRPLRSPCSTERTCTDATGHSYPCFTFDKCEYAKLKPRQKGARPSTFSDRGLAGC